MEAYCTATASSAIYIKITRLVNILARNRNLLIVSSHTKYRNYSISINFILCIYLPIVLIVRNFLYRHVNFHTYGVIFLEFPYISVVAKGTILVMHASIAIVSINIKVVIFHENSAFKILGLKFRDSHSTK